MSLRKLLLDIAHTSGTKIYSLVIALASVSLTARWLGPEGRGELVVATTWIGFLGIIGHLSLGQVAIHRSSQNRNETWLPSALGSLLFLTGVAVLVIWLVIATTYFMLGETVFKGVNGSIICLICISLPFFLWEYQGSSLLISQGKIATYNLILAGGRSLALLLLFFFVYWLGGGVFGGIAAALMGQILIAGGVLYSLIRLCSFPLSVSLYEIIGLLKGGVKLHINAIGSFIFGTVDLLLINRYWGAEEAAYYQLGVQLIGVMLVVPQSIAMVLYGQVANVGADTAWPQYRRVVLLTMTVTALIASLAWILAPWIVKTVAGDSFGPTVDYFRFLLLALVSMSFSTMMAPQWIGRGLFAQVAAITIFIGGISLTVCLILIPIYGAKGAIWASLVSYSLGLAFNVAMMVRCDKSTKLVN